MTVVFEDSAVEFPQPAPQILAAIRRGVVIPAHPLALHDDGSLDRRSQRALTRYYHSAGAGGLAVGVHTTQFAIRQDRYGLFAPVLELAADTARQLDAASNRLTVLIAGVCGPTEQAIDEAKLARSYGYHIGLLSLASLPDASDDELITHCRAVAEVIPIFGFYLQRSVGGRQLSSDFWHRFVQIPNVVGIKISPFDRYKTLDVVRAVAQSRRESEIALYTGNDDTIVVDLLTEYQIAVDGRIVSLRMVGGLLGHWACGTARAVEMLQRCQQVWTEPMIAQHWLTLAAQVTDCNAALFDAANGFAGCIAGIQYVLYRQGLLSSARCLDAHEVLSVGQRDQIDRVCRDYPHLVDDLYVADHVQDWLLDD